MSLLLFVLLLAIGGGVGFLSGLLGIGGGIVMFPLLFYIPPLVGLPPIPVKEVTGLTMVQGLFASLSAVTFYHQERLVNRRLVFSLGLSLFISSLLGAFASKYVMDTTLLFIFGLLAMTAAAMMLLPRSYAMDDQTEEQVTFPRSLTVTTGTVVGLPVGLVGQGGAFITIPIMLYLLKIPLRVALGSTLGIGLFSASAGTIGKVATGQVPFLLAIPLILAALPSARIGGYVSKRTDTRRLKWILAAIIAATAIKVWSDIL